MTHHPQVKEENSSVRKADESVLREEFEEFITVFSTTEINRMMRNALGKKRNDVVVDEILAFWLSKLHTERAEIQQDVHSILAMLDGDTDRVKIANYVRTYLLNNNVQ